MNLRQRWPIHLCRRASARPNSPRWIFLVSINPHRYSGRSAALQSGWNPPPPPPIASQPQKSIAVLSMVLGIVSITIGWCCYFGVLTSPVAIGLGIFSLFQIKNDPGKYGGKGMAIAGIVTGVLYFVFVALIILIYGLSFLMSAPR